MFANRDRREGFALPHGGGDTMSSTTPMAEEDTTGDDGLLILPTLPIRMIIKMKKKIS